MGKIGLVIDSIERSAKFARTCGKEYILATKPQNLTHINLSSLKPLRPLSADVCTFTKDPTLAPEVLDDLLNIKGTQTEQVMQIKDRFLRAMGYKPELIGEDNVTGSFVMGVSLVDGRISVGSKEFKLTQLIPQVRHELDHLDKAAKIIKSEGIEAFESAINECLAKRNLYTDRTVDRDFWLKFSKDADIRGFDSKKYLDALRNYPFDAMKENSSTSFYDLYCKKHEYCLNNLEKSAYAYEKKLLRYYGEDDTVFSDNFGENFRKIKALMDKYIAESKIKPVKNFSGPGTFDLLYEISLYINDPQGRKALKYFHDIESGKIKKDIAKYLEMSLICIELEEKTTLKDQKAQLERIYKWLREGKFSFQDFDLG